VDLGDWQELSRLRSENHAWHRCVDEIVESAHRTELSGAQLADTIVRCVGALNTRLAALGRRKVATR
jgi:hypothetical protein